MNTASANQPETFHSALQCRQVHTITDRFSMANTYIINDDRLVVVDPGSTLHVRLLQDYLQTFLHREPSEIDLIVLTHMRPNITADITALRRLCTASVAISALARSYRPPDHSYSVHSYAALPYLAEMPHSGNLFPHSYHQQEAVDLWLEDKMGLPFHSTWRIIADLGHAPDSLCLYNPFTHELLCGDTVSTGEGRAILRSGANRHQSEQLLHTLRALPIDYLYPGRGRAILSKAPLANVRVE